MLVVNPGIGVLPLQRWPNNSLLQLQSDYKCIKVRMTSSAEGTEVVISELSRPACPVNLLRRYLDKFHIPPISKRKGFCKLVSPNKPISYSCILDGSRQDLKNIGVDPSKFGFHSLRSGGATSAADFDINDRIFQRHGRWKSVEAKSAYVDDSIELRPTVSKFLGL